MATRDNRPTAPCLRALLALLLAIAGALAAPARAAEIMGQPRETIDVLLGQGRLLRFDQSVGSVLVGDPSIADVRVVSANVIYLFGSAAGRTNLIAVSGDHVLGSLMVKVSRDPAGADAALKTLDPTSAIDLTFTDDRPLVRGTARDVEDAMNARDTAIAYAPRGQKPLERSRIGSSQQINIRVRFAEVSRSNLQTLGINWQALLNVGAFKLNFLTGTFVNPISPTQVFGNASVQGTSRHANVEALLDALQTEGLLTTLAEPNLTTVSGENAEFLAGGEIPIPVPQALQVTTIQYKPFGVSLKFTPTLLPDNRIGLRVAPSVSALSAANSVTINGFNVPSLTVRSAEATVEVASGETFALAGLFQRDTSNTVSEFPFLGDLPVLGALFRSQSFQRNETELVILITPYLVQPTADRTLASPTDFRPAAGGPNTLGRPSAEAVAGFIVN